VRGGRGGGGRVGWGGLREMPRPRARGFAVRPWNWQVPAGDARCAWFLIGLRIYCVVTSYLLRWL
jgi:hypothetical protein